MKLGLVADQGITHAAAAFAEFGTVALREGRRITNADLRDCDVLLVRSVTRVDEALLAGTPVRYVGSATAGIDHVDTAYLDAAGIAFSAAPGCNARPVAEYVLAALLAWSLDSSRALAGLTAGIVGCGHVGRTVTQLLGALGVRCLWNDPPRAAAEGAGGYVDLDTALAADLVTLHVPLTHAGPWPTAQLLGARELERLRPGALLVNAARGGVVDEAALHALLDRPGAPRLALDCWQGEPRVDRVLVDRAFLATPHIAGHTIEARTRATAMLHGWLAAAFGHAPRWQPPADPAPRRVNPVPGADPLTAAVFAACDPSRDTARFKAAGADFDGLRRLIGERREFAHYLVASAGIAPDTVASLAALGFAID
ncbi:MAG: 4-phosphoerythronate dehydrogenase [Gammaproteobacteria bacterium]|nr:4-phosphoerythronate dehydrogenase [Gammaproteobacteria bacterium]MBI5618561.1 4-phosphoerythronate dehydrogenase [Gammaproteobacteria bacterium]